MCSGCFRKGEKSMRCQYCGNEMREGALFCSQCGNRAVSQAAPVKKICPNCGEEGAPDMLFCEYCGTRLTEKRMPEQPAPRPVPTPQPVPVPQPVPEPVPAPQPVPAPRGRFLMELNLMSYYKGEPTLGIAKATGTVKIYDDRLEFHKKMGNSAASMFGAVGMLAAAKQAKKGPGALP